MMNHYDRLRIAEQRGKQVILGYKKNSQFYKGILDIELTNEDYEEDKEKPSLALMTEKGLIEFAWEDIDFIADQRYLYLGEAV